MTFVELCYKPKRSPLACRNLRRRQLEPLEVEWRSRDPRKGCQLTLGPPAPHKIEVPIQQSRRRRGTKPTALPRRPSTVRCRRQSSKRTASGLVEPAGDGAKFFHPRVPVGAYRSDRGSIAHRLPKRHDDTAKPPALEETSGFALSPIRVVHPVTTSCGCRKPGVKRLVPSPSHPIPRCGEVGCPGPTDA
jgi:hypothetical protein